MPVTSLKAISAYITKIKDRGYAAICEVVTKFTLKNVKNPEQIDYSVLEMDIAGKVPDQWLAKVADYRTVIKEMLQTAAPVSAEEYSATQEDPNVATQ